MKKPLTMICAAAMAMELVAFTSAPALSAPMRPVQSAQGDYGSLATEVRHRRGRRGGDGAAIIGGLAAGAIIGGLIANSRTRYYDPYYDPYYNPRVYYRPRGLTAHQNWCLNRWRSYDVYSDTYQPNRGGRKYCNSPFN